MYSIVKNLKQLNLCKNKVQSSQILALRNLSYGVEIKEKEDCRIRNVTVLGGGVMGAGIAQAAAQSDFRVTVVADDEYSQKCLVAVSRSLDIIAKKKFPDEPKGARKFRDSVFSKISTVQDLKRGCDEADLVIEAVVEDLGVKQNIFKQLDQIAPKHTIFTSNTSSLSVKEIAHSTERLERFAGLHFFNPVWGMPLVEVIRTSHTDSKTYNKLVQFAIDLGKTPVTCPDTTGFIVNRLLYPYLMEALRFFERGHASIHDIDNAMKQGAGVPMGPFEQMDIIGLDVVKTVLDGWHEKEPNNTLFMPSELLNNLVLEGKLGRKVGIGFYQYKHKMY
uniref:3-hydroxyacyl-CoA dehydrogenase n=1 Tax=Clytia hemisphaerica TaxID=252671 RepID=A0A7M5WV82_9CNID